MDKALRKVAGYWVDFGYVKDEFGDGKEKGIEITVEQYNSIRNKIATARFIEINGNMYNTSTIKDITKLYRS